METIISTKEITKKPEAENLENYALLIQDSIETRVSDETPDTIIDSMLPYYVDFFLDLTNTIGANEAFECAESHAVIANGTEVKLVERPEFMSLVDSQAADRNRKRMKQLAA